MRDIVLAAVLGTLILMALFRPRIGAYAWTWFAMANPHKLAYGFARTVPWAQGIAIATLLGMLFSKERKPFPWNSITVIYVMFLVWMTITSFFAIASSDVVWEQWGFVMKIHLMIFATLMLVRGREQVEVLVWILALSLGVYGVKAGIWVVLSGGGSRVYGPQGGLLGNNNEFAIGLIATIPLLYYLSAIAGKRIFRMALLAAIPACLLAVLGSHSRGAFLGMLAMGILFALRARQSFRTAVLAILVLTIAIAVGLAVMPDEWSNRMQTISTYKTDGSAMSRIYIWGMIWELFKESPIVGGGFRLDNPAFFARYAPPDYAWGILGPHSIYFQSLGEHGGPGLLLYLSLGIATWRTGNRIIARTKDTPEYQWAARLAGSIQFSLTGFAVSGAFAGLVHLDLIYYLVATIVLLDASLPIRLESARSNNANAD